jgi:hypothetical protein
MARSRARRGLALLVLGSLAVAASAYYVPGAYPQEFRVGDVLQGGNLGGTGGARA